MRRQLVDVDDPALAGLSQLTLAVAEESLARDAGPGNAVRYDSAAALERGAIAMLDTLVPRLDGESVDRYDAVRALREAWHQAPSNRLRTSTAESFHGPGTGGNPGVQPEPPPRAVAVIAALAVLDQSLLSRSNAQRLLIRRVEQLGVLLPVLLVPLALASMVLVFGIELRTLRLAGEAKQGQVRLQQSIEAREALARGVTHDLKNPLGAARSYSELLEEGFAGSLTPTQHAIVTRLRGLIAGALESVTDMLEVSRIDAVGLSIVPRAVDLSALVRSAAVDHAALAAKAGVAIETVLFGDTTTVESDPKRVAHIVADLLSNALKYTPRGGRIRLSLTTAGLDDASPGNGAGRHVQVTVSDSGPGIPQDQRQSVFEEFARGSSADGAVPGTGIGLAASRRVARLLGGDITVSTSVWGGAAFTLTLPRRLSERLPLTAG